MKSSAFRISSLLVAITCVAMTSGCEEDDEKGASRLIRLAASSKPSPDPTDNPSAEASSASEAGPAKPAPIAAKPTPLLSTPDSISPNLSELVKLAQAGLPEEVLLAYLEKSTNRFRPTANDLIYLNDLGVSARVLAALIGTNTPGGTPSLAAPSISPALTNLPASVVDASQTAPKPPTNQVPAQAIANPPEVPPQDDADADGPTDREPNVSVSIFYNSLTPYGHWVDLDNYGLCWQPSVAVSNPEWRPYRDRGRWVWSDSGWCWVSDYSWGWAPFHYGRWFSHNHAGWVWVPGDVWAPAWVSWRYGGNYCGWAPLPPAAHFGVGFGYSYYGHRVGFNCEFGLGYNYYNFLPTSHFCARNPYPYYVGGGYIYGVYNNSSVVANNIIIGDNNTIVTRGVGLDTVANASQHEIQQVSVRQARQASLGRLPAQRIEREGGGYVLYRPQLPSSSPTTPVATAPATHREAARAAAATFTTASRTSHGSIPTPASGGRTTGVPGARPVAPGSIPSPASVVGNSVANEGLPAPRVTTPARPTTRPTAPTSPQLATSGPSDQVGVPSVQAAPPRNSNAAGGRRSTSVFERPAAGAIPPVARAATPAGPQATTRSANPPGVNGNVSGSSSVPSIPGAPYFSTPGGPSDAVGGRSRFSNPQGAPAVPQVRPLTPRSSAVGVPSSPRPQRSFEPSYRRSSPSVFSSPPSMRSQPAPVQRAPSVSMPQPASPRVMAPQSVPSAPNFRPQSPPSVPRAAGPATSTARGRNN